MSRSRTCKHFFSQKSQSNSWFGSIFRKPVTHYSSVDDRRLGYCILSDVPPSCYLQAVRKRYQYGAYMPLIAVFGSSID
jgi:hypothetical protein